jgi:hypothetical protein
MEENLIFFLPQNFLEGPEKGVLRTNFIWEPPSEVAGNEANSNVLCSRAEACTSGASKLPKDIICISHGTLI